MGRVAKEARLHESTVIAAPQLAAQFNRRRVRATPRASSRRFAFTVHPGVWAQALALANGDSTRLRVVSPTEVWVENTSRRK